MSAVRGQLKFLYKLLLKDGLVVKDFSLYNNDEYVINIGHPGWNEKSFTIHLIPNYVWWWSEGKRKCQKT